MSDQNLGQYQLDTSGVSPDNLIEEESHTLVRQRNRALALHHGAFFTESLVIKHVDTDYILRKHIDYKILQPYSTLIALTGKSVAGIILIHNSNVHQNISVTYQCVGGDFAITSKSLEGYLNSISDQGTTFSWYNSLLEDQSFEGDATKLDTFDFHWLCFTLEKIRNALILSDSEYYDKIREYLDSVLNSIEVQTQMALDHYLNVHFENFKTSVTKLSIGLGNVRNVGTASANEIIEASEPGSRITQFEINKYVTLQSLAIFKEQLYEKFALVKDTHIGLNRGVAIVPTMLSFFAMTNGAINILRSKTANETDDIDYDAGVYPPSAGTEDEFSVLKINNNDSNQGGMYLFSERSGKALYLVYHPNGNPDLPFVWNKLITEDDTAVISTSISEHLLDRDNPHQSTKESVGFIDLVNLPVVSREKIMSLQACREYVTMDGLLLFAKTYMVGEDAAAEDPRNDDREHVQIIYTAQAEDKCLPPDCPCPETPPPVEPPPADAPLLVKLNQYVNSVLVGDGTPVPNTSYHDYYSRVNANFPAYSVVGEYGYADGNGGFENTFMQVIKEDSLCAGFHPGRAESLIVTDNETFPPGMGQAFVDMGVAFTPTVDFFPQELYSNKEFVAYTKMPGRKSHMIRGLINNSGYVELPRELFGMENWHTGSDSLEYGSRYIALAIPYNTYPSVRGDANDYPIENALELTTASNNNSAGSYYFSTPVPVYLELDSHVANASNILTGTLTVYNIQMYFDNGLGTYMTNGQMAHSAQHYAEMDGEGFEVDGTFQDISPDTAIPIEVTNEYGIGAYRINVSIDISSLPAGYNILRYVVSADGGSRVGYSHYVRVYKQPAGTALEKTIPVFVNGVEEGTITITRDPGTQKLLMTPFKGSQDLTPEPLSNMYIFERSVTGSTDPFVFVSDVYTDETEFKKLQEQDLEIFLNNGSFDFGDNEPDLSTEVTFNQLLTNLENFKKNNFQADSQMFTKYTSSATVTEALFNSITRVRMVPYTDSDYACVVIPDISQQGEQPA